jgi:hypothetical protein
MAAFYWRKLSIGTRSPIESCDLILLKSQYQSAIVTLKSLILVFQRDNEYILNYVVVIATAT